MSSMTLVFDSNAIDALKNAISHHNDAAAIMSSNQYDTAHQAKATSELTKVLRTCQKIIGSLDDGNGVSSSSGKIVQVLLERCMNTPQEDLRSSEGEIPRCRGTTPQSRPNHIRSKCGSTLPPHEGDHTATISNESDFGFLYSKPIRIPPSFYDSHFILRCGVPNICMFLSCAATFNLALIYHILAQDQSTEELQKRSRGLLTKATRLYEICITLISEESHQEEEQEQQQHLFKDASIFDLATTNNLGMALEQLNEFEKAQKYFALTLSTLMCLICQTTAPGRASVSGKTILPSSADMDGFFRSASRVMSNCKAAPAA